MRIIVVDDELHALHDFLSTIIGEEEVEYRFFRDDIAAVLRYAKENDLDGAFLDINMTAINGFELAKRLLAIKPELKIAFITGLLIEIKDVPAAILPNVVSLIHKPYRREDLGEALRRFGDAHHPALHVKLFGPFDCLLAGRPILFSSSKSKELFALIVAYKGRTITMDHAIAALYPDKNLDKAKILYRDAVWRLRKTLEEVKCECVSFQRAQMILDTSLITCDYYDVLNGRETYYGAPFLPEYVWAAPFREELKVRFGK